MSDYISREAVMELRPKNIEIINSSAYIELDELLDLVGEIPAADVEPVVHGRWETFDSSYWRSTQYGVQAIDCVKIRCGLCGRGSAVRTNYCPNCGAKMDLEDGNDEIFDNET